MGDVPQGWEAWYVPQATTFAQLTPYDYQSVMHYPQTGVLTRIHEGVTLGGIQVSELDGLDLAAIYGPRLTPAPLQLELLSDDYSNPVRLLWRGGSGPYWLLAGTTPGGWDLTILSVGSATSLEAVAPRGITIYVTLATGTGWGDAVFGPTIQLTVH